MTSAFRALIASTAQQFGLSATLLEAQVWTESSSDPWALHYDDNFFRAYILNNPTAAAAKFGTFAACSLGLGQIELEVACEEGFAGQPWDLFDPSTGLYWMGRRMAHLVELAKGDALSALRAYNAGPVALHHADDDVAYAQRVLQAESELS